MPDLFGAPLGQIAANREGWANALNALSAREGLVKSETAEFNLDYAKKLQAARLAAISQPPEGQPATTGGKPDLFSSVVSMASREISGLARTHPHEALEDAGKLGALVQHQAQTLNAESQQALHKHELAQKEASDAAELLQGATDQESWDRGNAMYRMLYQKESQFAGLPFSPERKALAMAQLLSYKDKLTADHRAAQEDLANKRLLAESRHREVMEDIARQELKRKKESDTNRDKNSGANRPHKAPTNTQLKPIMDLLPEAVPEITNVVQRETFARAVYESAQKKVDAREADWDDGVHAAIAEQRKFITTAPGPKIPFTDYEVRKGKSTYEGGGRSVATALPAPAKPEDRKVGHYYRNEEGAVFIWHGVKNGMTQWERVSGESKD